MIAASTGAPPADVARAMAAAKTAPEAAQLLELANALVSAGHTADAAD